MYIIKQIIFSFLFIGFYQISGVAQNSTLQLLDSLELNVDKFVGVDKFSNLYFVRNNTVFKQSKEKDILGFQDFQLGDISRVDILNANKIIVFYKLSNVVVLLDNRMTEIDRQDFNSISPFKNIGFAGTSKDQNLWIYNVDYNQLELYDYRYDKTISKSLPIDEEVLGMENNFNLCYLKTDNSILIYNIYGSLVKRLLLENIQNIDLFKNQLLVYDNHSLKIFDKKFQPKHLIITNKLKDKNVFYAGEKLYIYNKNKLKIYSIHSK